jgi:hypothetical protein
MTPVDSPALDRYDALQGWADSWKVQPMNPFLGAISPGYQAGYAWQLLQFLRDPIRCTPVQPRTWYGHDAKIREQTLASLQRYYDTRDADVAAHEAIAEAQSQLLGGDAE